MQTIKTSMKEVKRLLNHFIDNNIQLQEEGDRPVSVGLEAGPGIGKTSIVEEIAQERGMKYTRISLAELEEAGDLCGFPMKEYEVQVAKLVKDDKGEMKATILPGTQWVTEKQLDNVDKGTKYKMTGKTRMGYAKPAWVPEYCEAGNIVNLDDFSRANDQLLQATMTLIDRQEYTSWKFPKKTTLVLTSNSDDGTNNVRSLDPAQQTRFLNFEVSFSLESWMRWAEAAKIDGRCINFVSTYYKELFEPDEQGNSICNPRSFVMFAKSIKSIKDWDSADNLNFINLIARGCFKDEQNRFAQMFSAFIRNKMHTLIQPEDMLLGEWGKIKSTLEQTLYDTDGTYRAEIATLLERRFSNYVGTWLDSDEKTPIATVKDRVMAFITNEEKGGKMLFNADLVYHMLSTITSEHKAQTNKLLYEPRFARILSA